MSIETDGSPPTGRIDAIFLWIARLGDRTSPVPILALAMAGMLFTQLGRTIHDVDIFWQLKLGEITLAHGILSREPFLAGLEDRPLAVVAWLAQVAYALLRHVGGWPLLWLVDGILWFAGFAIVAIVCSRTAANRWPVAIGLWVGWFAALSTASVRPQSFAALAFGCLIVLIRSNHSTLRTAILGSVLFVLWQNLHPSVVVGGLVTGAVVVAEIVQYVRGRRDSFPLRLFILLPLAALAAIATPAGFEIFRISRLNAEMSLHLHVAEWMPLTWEPRTAGRPFAWAMLIATIAVLALRGRKVALGTLAIVVVLTAAMLYSHRFVLFWGIAVIPLWCECLGSQPIGVIASRSAWRTAIAILAIALGIGIPCIRHPAPFADYYPFEGIRTLKAANIRGTIFTSYYWGGMIAEAGYPEWRVTHDGRYYLRTMAEWDRYFDETYHGTGGSLNAIIDRYHPQAFFLRPGSDDHLINQLRQDHRWTTIFADANCVVSVPVVDR